MESSDQCDQSFNTRDGKKTKQNSSKLSNIDNINFKRAGNRSNVQALSGVCTTVQLSFYFISQPCSMMMTGDYLSMDELVRHLQDGCEPEGVQQL